MTSLPRGALVLSMLTAIASTGCVELAGASLRLLVESAASSSSHGSGFASFREGATPVEGPVDRAMTSCELERGRWREEHQDEDIPPPGLRCLGDGSYPRVAPPPRAAIAADSPAAPPADSPASPAADSPAAPPAAIPPDPTVEVAGPAPSDRL